MLDGAQVVARCLKEQGIQNIFGIVGVPITPVADACQQLGINFYGMRNEQAASYAAGAAGYLTQTPGCCLTVSGPGFVHALVGLLNASANSWPMILISSASDRNQVGKGAFQEANQIEAARIYAKYVCKIEDIRRIPFFIEQAVRMATYGRPGPVYVELPGDIITSATVEEDQIKFLPRVPLPPQMPAHIDYIEKAVHLLKNAQRPLLVLGKGAAYARAEGEIRAFVEATKIPFITSPMGKGVVSDDSPFSVSTARSLALDNADVILVAGAKLNWMFGTADKLQARKASIIQIDISPEQIHSNITCEVPLIGDCRIIMDQLLQYVKENPFQHPEDSAWWTDLKKKGNQNAMSLAKLCEQETVPLNYHCVLSEIRKQIPRDAIIVSEGANTMDIGRMIFGNFDARQRLDSGTLGTMGVGLGYSIAAAVCHPDKLVVAVEGDSAFGFSGMEVEVMCRYKLPVVIFVINNNGIYCGVSELNHNEPIPTTALTPNTRYDRLCESFGGKGYHVTDMSQLREALSEIMQARDKQTVPTLVNVMITPEGFTPKIVQNQSRKH